MLRTLEDDKGNVQMIGAVVGILVTLIIAVLVFYNVATALDNSTVDANIRENVYGEGGTVWKNGTTFAQNATDDTLSQAATFFTIAPIIAIVIVAVIILKYVGDI